MHNISTAIQVNEVGTRTSCDVRYSFTFWILFETEWRDGTNRREEKEGRKLEPDVSLLLRVNSNVNSKLGIDLSIENSPFLFLLRDAIPFWMGLKKRRECRCSMSNNCDPDSTIWFCTSFYCPDSALVRSLTQLSVFLFLALFILRSTFSSKFLSSQTHRTKVLLFIVDKVGWKEWKAMNGYDHFFSGSFFQDSSYAPYSLSLASSLPLSLPSSHHHHLTTFTSLYTLSLSHSNSSHYTSNCILPFTLSHHFSRELKKK